MIDLSDPISRQQAITALRALSDEDGYINVPHEVVTDVVRGLPPVKVKQGQTVHSEQGESDKLGVKTGETCIDTISRQAAKEAVRMVVKDLPTRTEINILINDLPSAQPEPCEDFVKVVRCKKCRYVHCDKEFDNYWCNRMSGTFMVEAEGFCKWGR